MYPNCHGRNRICTRNAKGGSGYAPETPWEEPAAAVAQVPKKKKVEEEDPDMYCRISSLGFVNKQNCLNCGYVYGRGNLLTE